MESILISWVATTNDFFAKNEKGEILRSDMRINEEGPHINLYKSFRDFDTHYLLAQDKNDKRFIQWEFLASELKRRFDKKVLLHPMNINDVSDVGEIKAKIEELLHEFPQEQSIEVFINPGTPAMQTAWYLTGAERSASKKIRLFKRREKRYYKDNQIPPNDYLDFDTSEYAHVTNIREAISKTSDKKPKITKSLKEVYKRAYQVAGNNRTTVLIQGDTGTGKEYLAQYIHDNSHRESKPYITVNCSAYRGDLLESRLFGYEKGAFTGANKQTKGAFEDAHKGTIFLDEIGDISPRMQVTLLRVLEERQISRIGSTKNIPVDIRIITASNKDIWRLCKEGTFRYDLYYRLAIVELRLPSFMEFERKERKQWITYFLETMYTKLEKRYLGKLSKEVWEFLLNYPFYGNLRELRNTIETFYTFCDKEVVIDDIPIRMLNTDAETSLKLEDAIKAHIKKVVASCDGNISKASEILDKNRVTVRKYLK